MQDKTPTELGAAERATLDGLELLNIADELGTNPATLRPLYEAGVPLDELAQAYTDARNQFGDAYGVELLAAIINGGRIQADELHTLSDVLLFGPFNNGAEEFAEEWAHQMQEITGETWPDYLTECIDWDALWLRNLRHDYTEHTMQDGRTYYVQDF